MNNRKVITVDGLSGSGKTTLSKLLADKLNFVHLNSGSLYRAVGYLALQHSASPDDETQMDILFARHKISIEIENRSCQVFIDGENIEQFLRSPEVSNATSKAAALPLVRNRLFNLQREAAPGFGLVAEGRDMGSVVFPDADLKFYIHADEGVREERRLLQLNKNRDSGDNSMKLQIKQEISERDERDKNRKVAPAIASIDAIIIDNSSESLTEVLEKMYSFASKIL